ncbi:MAG: carboxypeptidase regulatory-like domain-containing protein, partial [Gammaproteobacteria bacterium]|nr:carboxypeptidase regulatory-like domain-containing protein [Gammaproteobacteria bacterium]
TEDPVDAPSQFWDEEVIWDSRANAHNPMLDQDGRVWYTARIRDEDNADFCKQGSSHPSAQLFPTTSARRQLSFYEPDTGEYTFVDTCYDTHHLQFSEDPDNTLWTSGDDHVAGWIKTRVFLETGDLMAAAGWSPFILDINANGEVDEWVEPDEPVDPSMDKRVIGDTYAVMPNPADGSVWYSSVSSDWQGGIVRFDPATGLSEVYRPPMPGFANRGADIDRNGVVWLSMGSGHLGQFDRSKCQAPLNGPDATGDHCPEGWSFHDLPGPGFVGLEDRSVESSYYTWVDQRGSFGLGENVPMVTGNLHDGIHVFHNGGFLTLRVPYPLGFYTKGFEGRIDDPDAGWKGRGLWIPSGDRTPFHYEGGKGTKPLVVHFQMRPDPLAK